MSNEPSQPLDWLSAAARQLEFTPASYFERVELGSLFTRPAPLEADIGCGEGAFLIARARQHPERNFLGIERMLGRVHTVCRLAAAERLENVRLVRIESLYAVTHLLPKSSVSVAHVLFPDPWPKRHHQPRRLIQDEFMSGLRGVLQPGGELRVKTDDLPYFQWMEKVFARSFGFERIDWEEESGYPITNFEQRFLDKGMPIHRARLRKV